MSFVLSSLSEGLLWSIMAIGVYLTFPYFDIADMTAEGAFPLGAAVVVSQMQAGTNPLDCDFTRFFGRYGSRSSIRMLHQDENFQPS